MVNMQLFFDQWIETDSLCTEQPLNEHVGVQVARPQRRSRTDGLMEAP